MKKRRIVYPCGGRVHPPPPPWPMMIPSPPLCILMRSMNMWCRIRHRYRCNQSFWFLWMENRIRSLIFICRGVIKRFNPFNVVRVVTRCPSWVGIIMDGKALSMIPAPNRRVVDTRKPPRRSRARTIPIVKRVNRNKVRNNRKILLLRRYRQRPMSSFRRYLRPHCATLEIMRWLQYRTVGMSMRVIKN